MKAELLLAEALAATPQPDASSVRLLLAELLDCSPVEIPLKGQVELSAESITRFWDWHARLQQAEPPQYILQKAWFYGLELTVNPSVLIPRPETEGLVELALGLLKPDAGILEIGTGSGAIAIALATHLPQAALLATDSSPAALELARRNALAHGCHIDFHLCDLFPDTRDSFDLIISNPPTSQRKSLPRWNPGFAIMNPARHCWQNRTDWSFTTAFSAGQRSVWPREAESFSSTGPPRGQPSGTWRKHLATPAFWLKMTSPGGNAIWDLHIYKRM